MAGPAEEPRWLTPAQVRLLHAEALRLFGGSPGLCHGRSGLRPGGAGLRDGNLLERALERVRHLFAYGDDPDLFDLTAAYASGLAKNHPFVDGNKRVALLAVRAFLFVNGFVFEPDQVDTVTVCENLAAGQIDQEWLAGWIRKNVSSQ